MFKIFAGALVATAAVWFAVPAPANAAPRTDGIQTTTTTDMSAHRTRYRHTHRRAVRYYTAPRYNGYYGPTYYTRPYSPPPPVFFGFGGRW